MANPNDKKPLHERKDSDSDPQNRPTRVPGSPLPIPPVNPDYDSDLLKGRQDDKDLGSRKGR